METSEQNLRKLVGFTHEYGNSGYDDRRLVKPTPAARALLPDAPLESPYPGAKPLLLVDSPDTPGFLATLIPAIAANAPSKTPGAG